MRMLYIFDMGNVVITNIHCMEAIAKAFHLDKDAFFEDYQNYTVPVMEGSVQPHAYWEHVGLRFHVRITGEPFADYFHPVPNPDVIDTIKRLRKRGDRAVCGSNTIGPHWDIIAAMGLTDDLFDATYPSHLLSLSKPEPEYYQYIMDHEHALAADTWFVDDYSWNIDAAAKLGIHTLLYDYQNVACREALQRL